MDWKSIISGVVGAVVTAIVFWLFGLVAIYIGQFPIPKHAVVALVEKECPIGWTAYTRGEGRYIVGLNPKGELEAEVGFKLKDHDDFPAGRHTHPYYDHAVGGSASPIEVEHGGSFGRPDMLRTSEPNGNAPEGTNAPYVQLLLCEKG